MNKYTCWGIVAGISIFVSIVGYWLKIMHHPYAGLLLTIGLWSLAVSAGVYFYFKFSSLKK